VKIGIGANRKIVVGKKKDADKSGIGIKIIEIARSSFTVGSKTSSYQLLETALSVMVIIGMIDQIGSIRTMIGVLMGRLEEGFQFMIGWGADSVCMTGLVSMLCIFLETKRSLRRWRMREFPMSSYFAEMLILTPQGQRVFVAKIFITKAYFFTTNQPLWQLFESPLVATNTRLTDTLVMIFCSPQMAILSSDKLYYH